MRPFFAQKPLASPPAGGITGHDAPQMLKTAPGATYASTFSLGNVTGVTAGERIIVHLHALGNSVALNPSLFAATLGGASLTRITQTGTTGNGAFPGSAILELVAGASGDLALDVDLGLSCRSALAVIWRLAGSTGTAQQLAPWSSSSSVTSQELPSGGMTVAAGSVVLASSAAKTNDTLAMTGVDGYTAEAGTDSTKYNAVAWGWLESLSGGSVTPASSWTNAGRCTGLVLEVLA